MNKKTTTLGIFFALALGAICAQGGSVNNWRGDETGADWTDQYKWDKKHTPEGDEAAYFRGDNSVINVNATIELNNGMHLYGQELSLQGNGNINMWSQLPHERTINIPASASGFANLTLNDNLSINGRVALSAKGFGTSASKGSITLKDRSNVKGALCIGNAGTGTGQVFVKGSSTYHITELQLATEAKAGGSAEIHVLGGTVRIETEKNPFDIFLADNSRKIIIGDSGTVRIESTLPISQKKEAVKTLIKQGSLVAAPGCRLVTPNIQNKMMTIKAEDERTDSAVKTQEQLLAAIDQITGEASVAAAEPKTLDSLLQSMRSTPGATPADGSSVRLPNTSVSTAASSGTKLAGYIVFFGGALLALR
ncbi:MAG: hypothetical protein OES84_05770, partial [Kiritimatiellaceae bacterium]|nr:hypothetical protein [Kiritimatiellaceae bacterium]